MRDPDYGALSVTESAHLTPARLIETGSSVGDSDGERCRYYQVAGITVAIKADLPFSDQTFSPDLEEFRVAGAGEDIIEFHHHFSLPNLAELPSGMAIYRNVPWAIYRDGATWVYLGILPNGSDREFYRMAVFNADHTRGRFFVDGEKQFRTGNLNSLSMLPTDQIVLARVLADRQACYMHAAGMIINGQGLLFVGHSEAGKSTTVTMLREDGDILCDDRIILRRWSDGFRIHGTWSHGDIPDVSAASAPLRAILILEQSPINRLTPIADSRLVVRELPFFVVKPLVTADWWGKTLDLIGQIAREVPVYRLQLDKSGQVRSVLRQLIGG